MKFVVLFVLIAWLVTSLPQDAFIWASTTHGAGSWHWYMSYGRAFLLGFLPILTTWLGGFLESQHLTETKRAYREIEKRWNRRAGRHDAEWIKANPIADEENFYATHITPAKALSGWVPRMFFLLITIISISYFGYYEEYGKDLKMFGIVWWKQPIGEVIFEPLVAAVRTFITGVVTYVLGKIAAVVGIQDLPADIKAFIAEAWAFVFPEKPAEAPLSVQTEKAKPRSEYSLWRDRDVEGRKREIIRYVRDHDPNREGVDVEKELWPAVWSGRIGSESTKYADITELIRDGVLEKVQGNGNGRRVRLSVREDAI